MTADLSASQAEASDRRARQRLQLEIDDLRFENARLEASVAERQEEIVALSERLALLQARLDRVHRLTAWTGLLGRVGPWRLLLRRR